MKTISAIDPGSLARISSVFLGLLGLIFLVQYFLSSASDSMYAPLGLWLPYLALKLDLHLKSGFALLGPFAYAATGAIDGSFVALLYNLGARWFGGVSVKTAPAPAPAQGATEPVVVR